MERIAPDCYELDSEDLKEAIAIFVKTLDWPEELSTEWLKVCLSVRGKPAARVFFRHEETVPKVGEEMVSRGP